MFSSIRRHVFGTDWDQCKAMREFDFNRYTDKVEQRERFLNAMYAVYWQTERARLRARSYRNFCVGCGVFAYNENLSLDGGRFRVFYGFNSKSGKETRNICAEPVALDGAAAFAYTDAIGIVVIGNTQEDEHGHTPKTLRPCAHCRLFMRNSPLVKPETIVITALPPPHRDAEWDEITHEAHSFKELCELYGE